MHKITITFLFGVTILFNLQAQQTVVKGQIIDGVSSIPIAEVSVSIQNSNLLQTTNENGNFYFSDNLPIGEQLLRIAKIGYETKVYTIVVEVGKTINLSSLILMEDVQESIDYSITLTDDELDEEESISGNTSGILQSSKDIFERTAAYEFSATFFRIRGLGSEYGKLLFNGIEMNKVFDGRPQWSNWGGINDVMRKQDFTSGAKANDNAFGLLSGTTNVNLRASQYRKGSRISYASSNRSYSNRVMATHASGVLKRGWSYAVSVGRRWAEEGYNDGSVYDANSFFTSAEKQLNEKHSLNFTGIYTPNRRGKSAAMTQEVYNLKGNQYNSYWGKQDDGKRNSRIREINEPILMLNHYWKLSDKTTLNTNVAYQFGYIGNSRIDYNASNPDPTYYKNLPSYALRDDTSTSSLANAYVSEQLFINDGQINWLSIYDANISNSDNAKYVWYEDRNDDQQWRFNTIVHSQINEHISVNTAVNVTQLQSHNYAKVLDLLGANSYLDIDYFDVVDNNILTPNRKVSEGDTFKYNYNLKANSYDGFVQAQFNYPKFDAYAGFQGGQVYYQREGLYQSSVDFDAGSLEESEALNFTKLGGKIGVTYKISGKHLVDVNGAYIQDAPTMRNSFFNARQNNEIVPDLVEVKTSALAIGYHFRSGIFNSRITGYYSKIQDATEVAFFYTQGFGGGADVQDFVQEATTQITKQQMGIEFGAEAQITKTIKLKGAVAFGEFIYANNPNVYFASGKDIINFGEANLKNYHVAGGPQRAYSLGFEYRDPKYWWFGATANLFSNAYIDVGAVARTSNFAVDENDGLPILNYDEDIAKVLLKQEQIDAYMLINLVGGKSWKIGKYYVGLFASVANVLGEEYKTGGYEQSRNVNYTRLLEDNNRPGGKLFGSKYWFGRGSNYYMNVYFCF